MKVALDLSSEVTHKVIGYAKKRNEEVGDTVKYILSKYFELRDDDIWRDEK